MRIRQRALARLARVGKLDVKYCSRLIAAAYSLARAALVGTARGVPARYCARRSYGAVSVFSPFRGIVLPADLFHHRRERKRSAKRTSERGAALRARSSGILTLARSADSSLGKLESPENGRVHTLA